MTLWGNVAVAATIGILAAFCEYQGMNADGLWVLFVAVVVLADFQRK